MTMTEPKDVRLPTARRPARPVDRLASGELGDHVDDDPPADASAAGPQGPTPRRLACRVHRFVRAHPALHRVAGWASRRVALAPAGSATARLLVPLRSYVRGEMSPEEVCRVVDAFDAAGLRFWLVGGWGVDALSGIQHRSHDDLDIALEDFDRDHFEAREALATLGYRMVKSELDDSVQMPHRSTFRDGHGHEVELVSLAWPRLAAELGQTPPPAAGGPLPGALARVVEAQGTVAGRRVPCVSASVQRFLLTDIRLRPVHHPDLRVLGTASEAIGPAHFA